MVHYIKILPEYYEAVISGRKTFEVRCNDRRYRVGDSLVMQEADDAGKLTGRSIVCKVTYILTDHKYVKDGFAILSILPIAWPNNPITVIDTWPETGEQYYAIYCDDGSDICENLCRHPEDKRAEHCIGCMMHEVINKLGFFEHWIDLSGGENGEG